MGVRRLVESALGQRIVVEIAPAGDEIGISRGDAALPDHVMLDERAARILSAYLSSALVVDRDARDPETYGDVEICMVREPAPLVRIARAGRHVDIHAPLWEALHCELDLILPRLESRR